MNLNNKIINVNLKRKLTELTQNNIFAYVCFFKDIKKGIHWKYKNICYNNYFVCSVVDGSYKDTHQCFFFFFFFFFFLGKEPVKAEQSEFHFWE